MTITTRIRSELFAQPADCASDCSASDCSATPTKHEVVGPKVGADQYPQLIRLPLTRPPGVESKTAKKKAKRVRKSKKAIASANTSQTLAQPLALNGTGGRDYSTPHRHGLAWTVEEHDRFLQGLERFPLGPWKAIATFVGTRTPRQTMTHAQKYRQKIQRRKRGLLTPSSLAAAAAETPIKYEQLLIDTDSSAATAWASISVGSDAEKDKDSLKSKSPVAVDAALEPMSSSSLQFGHTAPLETDWFENVCAEELDTTIATFLDEVYDPELMGPGDAWLQPGAPCVDDSAMFVAEIAAP